MRAEGFTLVELIVVVAIVALIATMAVPAFSKTAERNRAGALGREFFSTLSLARSTAVFTGKYVVICSSTNGTGCTGEGDWSRGWIVFEDLDRDKDCSANAGASVCADGGRLLRVRQKDGGSGIRLVGNSNLRDLIIFNPAGKAASTNGTLTLCSADNEVLGGMVVSTPGRIRKAGRGDATACP